MKIFKNKNKTLESKGIHWSFLVFVYTNNLDYTNMVVAYYSSEINQEEPIASSHVMLLLLSFIDTIK